MIVGAILGTTVFVQPAEAGDKRRGARRAEIRHQHHDDHYIRGRDVVVIREYYRPSYRPLPQGLRNRYVRGGYLPPGWAKRMRPLPAHLERQLVVVPHGYRRGVIAGNAVVYNDRGFILDVAFLF